MHILVDIGGTYIRFATSDGEQFGDVQKNKVTDFESFEDALAGYNTEKLPVLIATAAYPDEKGLWRFVNQNEWVIDPARLRKEGWPIQVIMNDFEAAVWGLKNLGPDDEKMLKKGKMKDLPKCLIGPGTGLGLGYLRADGQVQQTHGGHMIAAGLTEEHRKIINAVGQDKPVVFENLVSGPGLISIYRAVSANPVLGHVEELLEELENPDVQNALRLFHEFFGLFAQTVVVSGHAYGGLYLTGGVLDCLIERDVFDLKHFEKFFVLDCVDSVKQALQDTPIIHITHPCLSLKGLLVHD